MHCWTKNWAHHAAVDPALYRDETLNNTVLLLNNFTFIRSSVERFGALDAWINEFIVVSADAGAMVICMLKDQFVKLSTDNCYI